MTAAELAVRIEQLIADAREEGLSDEAIIAILSEAEQLVADARDEGLSDETIIAILSEAVEALKEGLS